MKGVNDVPSQNKVSYFDDILTTEFWLRKVSHPDKIIMSNKIIMSKEQIDCFNQEIQKRQSQIVRDLAVHHNDMPGDSIQSAIKQTFPQKHLYHQGQQLEKSFYDDLLQEMNVKGLKKTSKVQ